MLGREPVDPPQAGGQELRAIPARSATNIARSVATWSLRERPVWIFAADPAGDLGQPALDRHVDVLVGRLEWELARLELGLDSLEAGEKLIELGIVQHPGGTKGPGVRPRLTDVVGRQAAIEAQRGVELPEDGIGFLLEARHRLSL